MDFFLFFLSVVLFIKQEKSKPAAALENEWEGWTPSCFMSKQKKKYKKNPRLQLLGSRYETHKKKENLNDFEPLFSICKISLQKKSM